METRTNLKLSPPLFHLFHLPLILLEPPHQLPNMLFPFFPQLKSIEIMILALPLLPVRCGRSLLVTCGSYSSTSNYSDEAVVVRLLALPREVAGACGFGVGIGG